MKHISRNRIAAAGLAGVLLLGGCSAVRSHWPFGKRSVPAAQPVQELVVQPGEEGSAPPVLQFWERNTLVIDLTGVGSSGSVTLARRPEQAWPVRLAVRLAPGRFGALEVRGGQRIVLPVSAAPGPPVTAGLPPGLYDGATPTLQVRWGAAGAF